MKNSTKIFITITGLLTALMQIPAVQTGVEAFVVAHPAIGSVIMGISTILALLHAPDHKA